jgi:hypothetical protein
MHSSIIDELETDEAIKLLSQVSQNMAKAATPCISAGQSYHATSSLFGPLVEVFCSWAHLQITDTLPARKHRIQGYIANTCRDFEGEDVFDESLLEDPYEWSHENFYESDSDDDCSSIAMFP